MSWKNCAMPRLPPGSCCWPCWAPPAAPPSLDGEEVGDVGHASPKVGVPAAAAALRPPPLLAAPPPLSSSSAMPTTSPPPPPLATLPSLPFSVVVVVFTLASCPPVSGHWKSSSLRGSLFAASDRAEAPGRFETPGSGGSSGAPPVLESVPGGREPPCGAEEGRSDDALPPLNPGGLEGDGARFLGAVAGTGRVLLPPAAASCFGVGSPFGDADGDGR